MTRHRLMPVDDLWSGEMTSRVVAGRSVLVLRVADEVFAYADRCAHLGVPLSQGTLCDHVLTCSAHHYEYDARTGRGINPATTCLEAFRVSIDDGQIVVDTDDPP